MKSGQIKKINHKDQPPLTAILVLAIILAFAGPALALDQPISAGGFHSLALLPDGSGQAWGYNADGQLGNGTTVDAATAVQILWLSNAISVSAGYSHNLAATSDGEVWAWGDNDAGQLGDGTGVDQTTPVQVPGLLSVTAVSAGRFHSLALTSDGAVWAWGRNDFGQLGDGTTTNRNQPVQVTGLPNVTAIAAGGACSLALKSDGTVWAWGYNGDGQLGDGTTTNRSDPVAVSGLSDVAAIDAGGSHGLALTSDGTVWAWGDDGAGQLGDGPTTTGGLAPVQVSGLSDVTAIAAGGLHSLALTSDGAVWAWGFNNFGQLGNGTTINNNSPAPVPNLSSGVSAIAAGNLHSLVMMADGATRAWGHNGYGQMGDGTTTDQPTPVATVSSKVVIEAPATPDAAAAPGYSGHRLYALSLSPDGAAPIMESVSFKANGSFLASDIDQFQLRFSDNETLDPADTTLATLASPGANNILAFSGFSQTIADGGRAYLFLTADIATGAGGARTISISGPTFDNFDFADPIRVSGSPAQGGVQTFESAVATITAHPVSNTTALQAASGHALHALKLSVSDKLDAVLTDLAVVTSGDYAASDLSEFSLWFSQDEILDANDAELATHAVVASGETLSFSGFSQTLPAGSVGYLFIAADMSGAVEPGRTISIDAVDFDGIGFAVDPLKVGTDPAAAGPIHTLDAHPVVSATTLAVDPATVSQGTTVYDLYKIALTVSDNNTVLTDLTLTPDGTYAASDIARFRLYASANEDWDPGDSLLASSSDTPAPGQTLTFSELSLAIARGETIYLLATADIHEDAQGTRTLYIDALNIDDLAFDPAGTLVSHGGTLVKGGVQTFAVSPYMDVAAGFFHTLALKQNGTVWAWGNNEHGQLGDGGTQGSDIALQAADLTGVLDVAAGDYFSLALKKDGTVWAWGQNDFGQLGDGTLTDRRVPVQVSGLTNAVMVAAGDAHCAALMADGSVKTWGGNRYGQLGDGATNDSPTPLGVSGLSDIVAVAAGGGRTLALDTSGLVWAWGKNDFGQLGDGTTDNHSSPVQVSGLTGVSAIAAGDFHSLALKTDGTVWAWGNNENGQLGDGTTLNQAEPVQMSGLAGVSAIAAGNRHSLALMSPPDRMVMAWGWNFYGQLGDGTETDRLTPVQASDLVDVDKIAAGGDFSLARDTTGGVWAWGHNEYSQLGDGTSDNRNTPLQGGIIPTIQIEAPEVPAAAASRNAVDHILHHLKFVVFAADATLTDIELTTGGDYQTSDLAGQFRLYLSEDAVLDQDDLLLATRNLAPPGGAIRFAGMAQTLSKGTTRHLFTTVDVAAAPVPERHIFIDALSLEQIGFAERNVLKSGDDPLPAAGAHTFPALAVAIEAPAVAAADLSQNSADQILYRLNLAVTEGPADETATLSRLILTTDGDYRTSDIAGDGFKLRHSVDDVLDPDDPTLGVAPAVAPGGQLLFDDMTQPVSADTSYLFVTVDVSASAGGGRTLSIDETRLMSIGFAESFVAKTGPDPLAAGGTMAFPVSIVQAAATWAAAGAEQSAANHILYQIDLTVSNADAQLDGLTLTPNGDYLNSDILKFRLFYSNDDVLEPGVDPVLAEHAAVLPGTPLVFDNLSRTLSQGVRHLFLTADIGDYAVGRTISVAETPLNNFDFADVVQFDPAEATLLAAGGVQTFPTPQVTIATTAVPAASVAQDTPNHPVYRINLTVADARSVLNRIVFVTAGTYIPADIDRFRLWFSEDEALDGGDVELGTREPPVSGAELVFSNLSLTIEKGTAGHIFLTADIGAANGGRTVNIAETPFAQFDFLEPDLIMVSGNDPLAPGAATTFPVPAIAVTAPQVPATTIAQDVSDLILYRINLAVSQAEAVLTAVSFVTSGTYQIIDLVSDNPFKLRYSKDEVLDAGDPVLGEHGFVNPGETLNFFGLSRSIPKETIGHLFLTADIGQANGARTIAVNGMALGQLAFAFGDKTGNDPMTPGGVQTFPIPAIAIAPVNSPASDNTGQHKANHVLCGFRLSVERAEATLEKLTVRTAGTYLASDLAAQTPFTLWHSNNDTFNTGDEELASAGFVASGGDLVFDNLSKTIDKETIGYLFVTADIDAAVGRHIFIFATPFDNLIFAFGDKSGDDPISAFARQQFPVPAVAMASESVALDVVEPRTTDHILYQMNLAATEADAILESVRFPLAGTYRASDIRSDCSEMNPCIPLVEQNLPVFKLWFSDNDVLEKETDAMIADSLFVASGGKAAFNGLNRTIPKNRSAHLFLTANIGPGVPDRTIYVNPVPLDAATFSFREKTEADPEVITTGTDPLTAGGVQTIAQSTGKPISMDGVDDYIDIPFDSELNPTEFTVSARAGFTPQRDADGNAVRTRQTIVASINEETFSGYEIYADRDNKFKFRIGTGTGWEIVEGPEVADNRLYDLSGVYDGTMAVFYVDGQSYSQVAVAEFAPNESAPFQIGRQPDGDSGLYGQVAEALFWNVARTQEDIAASIETPPNDDESGVVAHYRFLPWNSLVDTTGHGHDGAYNGAPVWASALSGLWIGQIEITGVNELGFGTADTETPRDVANPFDMRVLLHVDDKDAVRLVRHVTLMQQRYTVENEDGTTTEMARRVLITDDDRLGDYEGVVRRDGKLTGVRLGSLFFDFDPDMDELPLNGTIEAGSVLSGDLTVAADHPRNPFRHRFQPGLRSGLNIHRTFSLTISPDAELDTPEAGVFELKGVYEETIQGLHKLPIRMAGTFQLQRVSVIPVLNDGE